MSSRPPPGGHDLDAPASEPGTSRAVATFRAGFLRLWSDPAPCGTGEGGWAMMAERGSGSRHHLIVVADVESFGDPSRTAPHLQAVRDGLDTVMRAAFAAAEVVWENCY